MFDSPGLFGIYQSCSFCKVPLSLQVSLLNVEGYASSTYLAQHFLDRDILEFGVRDIVLC